MDQPAIQEEIKKDRRTRTPSQKAATAAARQVKKRAYVKDYAKKNPEKRKAIKKKQLETAKATGRWKCDLCDKCYGTKQMLLYHQVIGKAHKPMV